jgi:threonine/homoserine/homoserine lactone efflux protein
MLVWMGTRMAWGAYRDEIKLQGKDNQHSIMNWGELISLGVVTTLSNPFWYAWWITVAAGYLAQAQSLGFPEVAAFYLGHISADYAWDTVLSAVVGGGRNWITQKIYRGMLLFCGAFIVYLGAVFIINGIIMSSS